MKKGIHTIEYTMRLRPQSVTEKKKRVAYARPVTRGTVSNKDIADELSRATTLTATDVEAVLTGLEERLIEHLRRSETVKINGIGSFSVRISSKQDVDSKGNPRMDDLRVSGVLFRPTRAFLTKIQDVDFNLTMGRTIKMPSAEEVMLKLDEHFAHSEELTSSGIMRLFQVSRRRSHEIAAKLVEEGVLVRYGNGSTTHYRRTANP